MPVVRHRSGVARRPEMYSREIRTDAGAARGAALHGCLGLYRGHNHTDAQTEVASTPAGFLVAVFGTRAAGCRRYVCHALWIVRSRGRGTQRDPGPARDAARTGRLLSGDELPVRVPQPCVGER